MPRPTSITDNTDTAGLELIERINRRGLMASVDYQPDGGRSVSILKRERECWACLGISHADSLVDALNIALERGSINL